MSNERDIAEEIVSGLEEAQGYVRGDDEDVSTHVVEVEVIDIKAVRDELELTQQEFADSFGFSLSSVRNWEQGRRRPDKAARILLKLIEEEPEVMWEKVQRLGHVA
jgi:putative transcriptional regulator